MLFPSILMAVSLQPSQAMLRQLFEETLVRKKAEYGDSDTRTAQAARDLGLFLAEQGDRSRARDCLAEAVQINERALGPSAAPTLADIVELAGLSPPKQAEPLWHRAAASTDAAVAARALGALGALRENAGDRAVAAKFYRHALAKEQVASGRDSARVAVRLNALARAVKMPESIALLERALAINRRRLGPRHPETATIEANLAALLVNAGRAGEAVRLASNAMSILEETAGAEHPRTAVVAAILVNARQAAGLAP